MDKAGKFVISLDFELFWGVSENKTIKNYGINISNTHDVVNKLLNLFSKYNIEATWATVGFIFFNDINKLKKYIKKNKIDTIKYKNKFLNNFLLIDSFDDFDNRYLFALDLVNKIIESDGQELASHTFSHMYTLEDGVTNKDIKVDTKSMFSLFSKLDLSLNTVVFPRNQYSEDVIDIMSDIGVKAYRGNQSSYLYKPSLNQNLLKRFLRLLDSYVNISGFNSSKLKEQKNILDIPASRFLRPYNNKLRLFEKLRLQRIKNEMTFAAKTGSNYHLWWHPHNFGSNCSENLAFLEKIISHQKILEKLYGFESKNMRSISKQFL